MSAFLTSRDYALRLALSLVVATEGALFGLLFLLNGFDAPHFSFAIVIATIALIGAALSHLRLKLAFGATALATELIALPSHGKLAMLIAGLHAAHVFAGVTLVAWALALPRWRREPFARLTSGYWYFVAITWLAIGPFLHVPRS